MESLGILDSILLIGICQGVFLSLTLKRISNTNRSANGVLSLLLLISTLMLVGRYLFFRFLTIEVFMYSLLGDALVFLFGPLIYTYVRRMLYQSQQPYHLPKWHYAPFVIFLLVCGYYFMAYNPETYYQAYRDGELTIMFNTMMLIMIGINMAYLWASYKLLRRFRKQEKQTFAFDQDPVRYLSLFLGSLSLTVLAWAASYINYKLLDRYFDWITYDTIWVAIPVFIYVVGYFSLKQPELFRIKELPAEDKVQKDRLQQQEALALQQRLDSLMLNEKIFLKNNLTLAEVAEHLQTSPNNLSWLLNQVYKTTFYDFINQHRVQEFVRKVENKEHLKHTILALSMDVGFNSKSTFNKAFKQNMKDTPSNFIKKHRAA